LHTHEKTQLIEKLQNVLAVIKKMGEKIEVETASKLISNIEDLQGRIRPYFKLHDEALAETALLKKSVDEQEELKEKLEFEVKQQELGNDPKNTTPVIAEILKVGGFNVV
jgi:hypothetical protein